MKIEEWIGMLAAIFLVGVVVVALLPSSLFNMGFQPDSPAMQAGPVGSVTWAGPGTATAVPVAAQTPASMAAQQRRFDARQKRITKAQPGLMPFEQAPRVRFAGRIQQISEMPRRDGQIHIWLNDATTGQERHISVSPKWFLDYQKCTLFHDMDISGVGFQFDGKSRNGIIYAKKIVAQGTPCQLRNDEGFALWSNQLR
ncbi:MAG: hypothetical protein HQL52_17170 [Magnetococcales bacterium]|nr:hypothetical protein [Magnetococcales bacterium]